MAILLLKLVLTPVFIGAVTLAGRRWGPGVTGMLVGLPLTSGPVSVFLAMQYGPAFAARAGVANLAGQGSVCLFSLVYAWVARRHSWVVTAPAALAAFLVMVAGSNRIAWSLGTALVFLGAGILTALRLLPAASGGDDPGPAPRWDLPARMIVATGFVLALTTAARCLGPRLSGLLAPFPVFGVVLAAFTHSRQGAGAAARLLRGNMVGSVAFVAFFLVACPTLGRMHLALVYLLASLASVAASAGVFLTVGRKAAKVPAAP